MTENTTDGSAVTPEASGQDSVNASGVENQETKDQVAYETYRKTLSEAKRFKSETAELRAKLEQYEQSQLEEQGKYQELNEKLRKERDDILKAKRDLEVRVAEEKIRSQVTTKAKELGCIDTDALTKLVDFDGLDVDDGYSVSSQSLDMVLKKAKQDKPYLFSNNAPKIRDGVPAKESGQVDVNKMSKEQIKEYAKKLGIR